MDTKKPNRSEPFESRKNGRNALMQIWLNQLGVGLGQTIPQARIDFYTTALQDLSEKALAYAFTEAARNLGEFLPSVEGIRILAEEYREEPEPAARLIIQQLEEKAEPLEERKELYRQLVEVEIPKAFAAAKSRKMPSYREACEFLARQRLGPSTMPSDPIERKAWATRKAREQGLL